MFSNLYQLSDLGLFILRIGIAASFLFHGSEKLKMWKMQPSKEMPAGMLNLFRMLSIVEPLAALGLILGFLTQVVGLIFGVIMIGAILMKTTQMKKPYGKPGGWELDAVLLSGSVMLFFMGGGTFSLDYVLF